MDGTDRSRVKARMNRIAGQLAGIQRMIDEDRYCVEILHQIAAVRSALDSLGVELLSRHIECCVLGGKPGTERPGGAPMTQDELVAEVRTVLTRFLK